MRQNKVVVRFLRITLVCLIIVSMFSALPSTTYAANFGIGDTVEVYNTGGSGLLVRDDSCGNVIGGKFDGDRGVVLDGPVYCNNYNRWLIRWSDGLEGWSAENWLKKVSQPPSPPSHISPSNGATGVLLTPTFRWSAVSSADRYGLYVSEPPYGPANLVYENENLTGTSVSLPSGRLSEGVTYYWNMRAYNSAGWGSFSSSWSFTTLTTPPPNQPPTCSLSANPRSGDAPLTVTFSMSASDPDGLISAWVLDVDGDGQADYSGTGSPPSTRTHTYTASGNYSVVLMVSDNRGDSAHDTETVNVGSNDPPTCSLSASPRSGSAPLTVTFSMSASDSDGSISAWALDADGDGTTDFPGNGTPPPTRSYTYTSQGNYTAVLMVSDNDDATASDTETISVSSISLPDLAVNDIQVEPSPPTPGGSTTISITISNQGDSDATETFFLEFYFDGTHKGHVYVDGLAAGASRTSHWYAQTWPSDTNPHTITGKVDPDRTVSESNEGNNELSEQFTAAVNQPPTCSLSANPRSGDAPLTVTFSMSASDPDGLISAWVLDVDGDGQADYSGTGSPPSTRTHTYTASGNYSVVLMVSDNRGDSAHDTETVNVGSNDPPTCSLSASPRSGSAPLTVTFSMSASDSDGSISAWALDADGDGTTDFPGNGTPPPTRSYTYTSQGNYTAVLMVSDNDDATASDTETITVGPRSPKPDLIIKGITWSSPSPSIGDTVTFTVTIKNQGTGKAGNSKVYYFIDDVQKTYDYVNSIDPGAIATETFTWKAQAGSHIIKAVADYKEEVAESDETNNDKPVTFSTTALSDLIIEGITWSPPRPSIGETVTFTVTIKNQGTGKAGSSKVYYFIDDAQHGYDYVSAIDPGATATETFTRKVKAGSHAIKAVADYKEEVAESNETNNDKTTTFSATEAKPVITSPLVIVPEKDTYTVGETVTATFTITNIGTVPITLDVLTVGGRDPDDQVADFDWHRSVTLAPETAYDYQGSLTLSKVGNYHFFCTYQTPDGNWNTGIDLGPGLTDEDRVKDIEVLLPEGAYIASISPDSGIPGDKVTIIGINFPQTSFPLELEASVAFGNQFAEVISYAADETEDKVVCVVPQPAVRHPSDRTVEVALVSGYISNRVSNLVTFTYDEPVLEALSPPQGLPGKKVRLEGNNFGHEEGYILFGNSPANIISWTNSEIIVEAPSDYGMGLGPAKTAFDLLSFAVTAGNATLFEQALDILSWFVPDLYTFEFSHDEPLWEQWLEIAAVIALPATVHYNGDVEVDVTVSTVVAVSDALTFTFTDILQIDVEDTLIVHLCSPGELRVYDSHGRVTGLLNGEIREEIPNSVYGTESKTVVVFSPSDPNSYRYEVVGTSEGTYGLEITSVGEGEADIFTLTDVATSGNAVHEYTIDWDALCRGEPSIAMQIDSDGDKTFEQTKVVQPPIASFIFSPIGALANEEIDFDASESRDVDGEIVSYKWNFGDGNASTGRVVTHAYLAPGEYAVTLAVVDNDGVLSTYSKVVQVEQRQAALPSWVLILISIVTGFAIAFAVWRRTGKK